MNTPRVSHAKIALRLGLVAACLLAVFATASSALASDPGSSVSSCASDGGGLAAPGTAVVDGIVSPGEWGPNVTAEYSPGVACPNASTTPSPYPYFFANMYRAAKADFPLESRIYLKIDTANKIGYILVLAEPGVDILKGGDQYVKFGQTDVRVSGGSGNNGTPPDFAFVGTGSGMNTARGWEASFRLYTTTNGSDGCIPNLNVHAQVGDGGSQTSAVWDRSIKVTCPPNTPLSSTVTAGRRSTIRYEWDVEKSVDNASIRTVESSYPVNYTVTATRTKTVTGTTIAGTLTVTNGSALSVNGISAQVSYPAGACTIDAPGGSIGTLLTGAFATRTFTCTGASLGDAVIAVTTYTSGSSTFSIARRTTVVDDPTPFVIGSPTATLKDFFRRSTDAWGAGTTLTPAMSIDEDTKQWTYTKNLDVPDAGCVKYENYARAFDTGDATLATSATVEVDVCRTVFSVLQSTATPTYTRTYPWTLTKTSADNGTTKTVGTGEAYPANYTIVASRGAGADSLWKVSGTITITNNDTNSIDVDVADRLVNGGGTKIVDCAVSAPAGYVPTPTGSATPPAQRFRILAGTAPIFTYECLLTGPTNGSNRVTVTLVSDPTESFTDSTPYTFGAPTTKLKQTAILSDIATKNNVAWTMPGAPTATALGDSPAEGAYSWTIPYTGTLDAGSGPCPVYRNKARLTFGDSSTIESSPLVVITVCEGGTPDPVSLEGTAAPTFTRTWPWTVEKQGDIVVPATDASPALANYVIDVNRGDPTDSDFAVSGTATVTNTTAAAVTVTGLTATLTYGPTLSTSTGASCSVTSPAFPATVAAGATLTRAVTCSFVGVNPIGGARLQYEAVTSNGTVTYDQYFSIVSPTKKVSETARVGDVLTLGPTSSAPANDGTGPIAPTLTNAVTGDPVVTGTGYGSTGATLLENDTTLLATGVELDGPPGPITTPDTCLTYRNRAWVYPSGAVPPGGSPYGTPVTDYRDLDVCLDPPGTPPPILIGGYGQPEFTRSYDWTLTKTVLDAAGIAIPSEGGTPTIRTSESSALVRYRVTATRITPGSDSLWKVRGAFTLSNSTGSSVPVSVGSLALIGASGTCTFDAAKPTSVLGNNLATLAYTCTLSSDPGDGVLSVQVPITVDSTTTMSQALLSFLGATPTREVNARQDIYDELTSPDPDFPLDTAPLFLRSTESVADLIYYRGLPAPEAGTCSGNFVNEATTIAYSRTLTATGSSYAENPSGNLGPAEATVRVCRTTGDVGDADVTVTTLRPKYNGRYDWELFKDITQRQIQPDGRVDIKYSISVTRTESMTPSEQPNYRLEGAVRVRNNSTISRLEGAIATVNIDGDPTATCTFNGTDPATLPAPNASNPITLPRKSASATLSPSQSLGFTCTNITVELHSGSAPSPVSNPTDPLVGQVVVELDDSTRTSQLSSASLPFDFSSTPTSYTNPGIRVQDIFAGTAPVFLRNNLVLYGDDTIEYTKSVYLRPDECLDFDNSALAIAASGIDSEGIGFQSTYGYARCPTTDGISFDAAITPSFQRSVNWTLTKSVGIPVLQSDGSVAMTYQVDATRSGNSDSGYVLEGTVSASNSNPWPVSYVTLRASLAPGAGTCSFTRLTNVTIPAYDTVEVPIRCVLTSGAGGFLRVAGSRGTTAYTGLDASYAFTSGATLTQANSTVTVTDQFNGGDPIVLPDGDGIANTTRFVYRRIVRPKLGCNYFPNTARLTSAEGLALNAAVTVQICVNSDGSVNFYDSNLVSRTIGRISTSQLVQTQGTRNAVLLITKSGPTNSTSRRVVNYQVRVLNAGGTTLRNVVITDMLPSGLDFSRVTLPSKGQKLSPTRARWTIKSLGAGKSVTLKVPAWVVSGTKGRKCNIAMVTATGAKQVQAKSCMVVKGTDPGSSAPTG